MVIVIVIVIVVLWGDAEKAVQREETLTLIVEELCR